MTAEQFLAWAKDRPGRHELVDGEVFSMSPQRVRHADIKFAIQLALRVGLRDAGLPCRMLPDGITVRIDDATVFEPDALVYCGNRRDGDAIEAPAPIVVVVEVLSPETHSIDTIRKLDGYFRVPSVMHYPIVDPKRQLIVHHRRASDTFIETRIAATGTLDFTPPGLVPSVAEVFAPS